jgi:hypothetical protein
MKKLSLALLAMATALAITPAAMADSVNFWLNQPESTSGNAGTAPALLTNANSVEVTVDETSDTTAIVTFTGIGASGDISAPVLLNVAGEFSAATSYGDGLAPGNPCGGDGYTGDAHNCAPGGGDHFGTMDLETGGGSSSHTIVIDLTAEGTNTWADAADVLTPTTGYGAAYSHGFDAEDEGLSTSTAGYLAPTPEPSSLFLFGSGLLGLAFVAFRKAKASGPGLLNM